VPEPLRRFLGNRAAVAGAGVLLALAVAAFLGPFVHGPDQTIQPDIVSDEPPSLAHPFGTSRVGHDLLGQSMRATQQSLLVAALAGTIATVLGTLWGAVAGYYRGWADAILMRIVDVALVVPLLVVVLVLAGGTAGTSWRAVGLVIGLFGWLTVARVVRAITVSLREHEFVAAARALGAPDTAIIARHVLPHVLGAAVVTGSIVAASAILLEAALSFVGFGVAAPDTSLGLLVAEAQGAAFTRPWLFFVPGAVLVALCTAVTFVGDGLRDALHVGR
jgi:peptide/nickel transport system permease protein